MKRLIALFMFVLMLLGSIPAFGATNTRMVYNNKEVSTYVGVIFRDGYTFLPAAFTFKAAGMKVTENTSNNSLTAESTTKSGYVSIWVNSKKGVMNGQTIQLGIAPFRENGVIYVSSKFIEEQCGVKVSYDSSKNTIYINSTGEGKITSTVGQAKSSTTAASSYSTSSKGVYANTYYIPDFGAVTGCKATATGRANSYNYNSSNAAALNKYKTALANAGFSLYASQGNNLVAVSVYHRIIPSKGSEIVYITSMSNGSYVTISYSTPK